MIINHDTISGHILNTHYSIAESILYAMCPI